jgi:PAS domain S-box-containing protein
MVKLLSKKKSKSSPAKDAKKTLAKSVKKTPQEPAPAASLGAFLLRKAIRRHQVEDLVVQRFEQLVESHPNELTAERDEREHRHHGSTGATLHQELYSQSPFSIREENWSHAKEVIDQLRDEGIIDFARYFQDHRDIARDIFIGFSLVSFNPASLALYRAPDEKTVWADYGRKPKSDEELDAHIKLVIAFAGGETTCLIEDWEDTYDGGRIYTNATIFIPSEFRDSWSRVVFMVQDASERKVGGAEKDWSNHLLEIINRTQARFIADADLGDLFEQVARDLLALSGGSYALIGELVDDPNGAPYLTGRSAALSGTGESSPDGHDAVIERLDLADATTPLGKAAAGRQAAEERYPERYAKGLGLPEEHPPLDTVLALPLKVGNALVGVVALGSGTGGLADDLADRLAPLLTTCASLIEVKRGGERRFGVEGAMEESAARLSDSEEKFRSVIANVPAAIYSDIDDDWTIQFMSDAIEEITGYSAADFIKRRVNILQDVLHPDDVERVKSEFENHVSQGAPFTLEYRMRHADRSIRWIVDRGRPIFDEEGGLKRVDGALFDVTEQKAAEERLRASEDQFQIVVENIPGAVYRAQGDGWSLSYMSDGIEAITGYPAAEVMKDFYAWMNEVVDPADLETMEELLAECAQDKTPFAFDYRIQHADGGIRWIHERAQVVLDENGKVQGFDGLMLDITERKLAEEAARESETRSRVFFDNIPTLINLKDLAGRYIFVNAAYEQQLGLTQDEIVGKTAHDFFPPEAAEETTAQHRQVLAEGRAISGEIHQKDSSGEEIVYSGIRFPVPDADGNLMGVGAVYIDTTERTHAQEAVTAAHAELHRSEEQFHTMVANVPGIIYRAKAGDWTMEFMSDAVEALTGYPASDFIDNSVRDYMSIVHPDDLEAACQSLEDSMAAKSPVDLEYRVRHADGSVLWVHEQARLVLGDGGEVKYLDGAIFDVTEQKEAAEALAAATEELRESLERFDFAVSTTTDGLFDWDIREGTIWRSPRLLSLVGYGNDEMGLPYEGWKERLHPDDRERAIKALDDHLENKGEYDLDFRVRTKAGSYKWIHSRGQAVWDEDGKPIRMVGSVNDITKRKEAEEALETAYQELRESEERFRSMIGNVGGAFYRSEAATGRVVFISQVIEEITGKPMETFVGMDVRSDWSILHPEDAARVEETISTSIDAGEPFSIEYRIAREDESVRWLYERGCPVTHPDTGELRWIDGFIFDVTEQKESEEAIRKNEALIESLLENSPAQIDLKDIKGRYVLVNRQLADHLGVPKEELIGKTVDEFYPKEFCKESMEHFRRVVAEGRTITEEQHTERDGKAESFLAHRFPVLDSAGNVSLIGTIHSDITELKLREEELRESEKNLSARIIELQGAQEQLEEQGAQLRNLAENLTLARDQAEAAARAKSEFLAMMSHEIRTPMNGVLGMTGLLLETELTETQLGYAKTVQDSSQMLLSILNDILDYSKLEAGKLVISITDFDPRELVEGVVELFGTQALVGGIELATYIAPDVPRRLQADAVRLRQVMVNLLSNAIKFTKEGGVTAELSIVSPEGGQAELIFSVTDTGIGIAPDAQEALFTRFTQGDSSITRRFGGTGLGLAISKELLQLMGGEISLESKEGKGSRFWFKVPVARGEEESGADVPAGVGECSVLLVSTNPISRDVLERQMESWGATVTTATSDKKALQGLRAAAKGKHPFDIAILDAQADVDRIATSIREKPQGADLPLVVVRGAGDASAANDELYTSRLQKPVRPSALHALLAGPSDPVHVPAVGSKEPKPVAVETESSGEAKRGRVLFVDDNPINRRFAHLVLEDIGLEVQLARDGQEAVSQAEKSDFDLVFMDIQMPEIDGFEASRQIRELSGHRGKVPIIALSSKTPGKDRSEYDEAGMIDYLVKPIKKPTLVAKAELWLEKTKSKSSSAGRVSNSEGGPVLDDAVINELESVLSPEALTSLIQENTEDARDRISRIFQAIKEEDLPTLRDEARNLKSALGNFGALRASNAAAAFEVACKEGRREDAIAMVPEVNAAVDAAIEALSERYLTRKAG